MKTWTLELIKTERYRVEVNSARFGDLERLAIDAARELPPSEVEYATREEVQLGEPWAYSRGWYNPTDDVVVVERATGNIFTGHDVQLLRDRLDSIGFRVLDSWNGKGYKTVSFRCSGRQNDADFTPEQLAALLAPRLSS